MFNVKELESLLKKGETDGFKKTIDLALAISRKVREADGRAVFVGGIVRDLLLKHWGRAKSIQEIDIDIEVFSLDADKLEKILQKFGQVKKVGASFAVFKIGNTIDVSLPRTESKTGKRHRDFSVNADPHLTYREAAGRRSYTINSIGLDPLTGEVLDPYSGIADLKNSILKAVKSETFVEDALRVLRGMQFLGRFDLSLDPATLELCKSMDLKHLSPERVGEEWMKLLLKAKKPSAGLKVGVEMGIFEKLHPEIHQMKNTPQEKDWHPEGDVWQHTLLTVDEMAKITRRESLDEKESEPQMLAALLHDIGKPETTEIIDNRIRSYRHNVKGTESALRFMQNIKRSTRTISLVLPLIAEHHFLTFSPEFSLKTIRRLAVRLQPATIKMLAFLMEADIKASNKSKKRLENVKKLTKTAEKLAIIESMPEPIITGKILISKNYKPGPEMGDLLEKAYKAQLDGLFYTLQEALIWIEEEEKGNS